MTHAMNRLDFFFHCWKFKIRAICQTEWLTIWKIFSRIFFPFNNNQFEMICLENGNQEIGQIFFFHTRRSSRNIVEFVVDLEAKKNLSKRGFKIWFSCQNQINFMTIQWNSMAIMQKKIRACKWVLLSFKLLFCFERTDSIFFAWEMVGVSKVIRQNEIRQLCVPNRMFLCLF